MSILKSFSLFFGMNGQKNYKKTTGLKEAINALINKSKISDTVYSGKVSTETWNSSSKFSLDDTVILKKKKGKDFVILNLTDMHFSDYDIRSLMAFSTSVKIRTMVANTKPDLITVTGDIVCSDSTYYAIRRFTDLMESFGIPWAPVFGNHDKEANCDENFLADIMMNAPNCLMKKGDPEMGVGNYIVNIAEENEDGTLSIKEAIILMNSHGSQASKKQVEWFTWASDGINEITGNKAEISLMFHIPLPEYQYAYDIAWNAEKKKWNDGYGAFGELHEKICCERDKNGEPVQRGFFEAIKASETVNHIFCGHEHLNNFSVIYEGIRLTYTMKVGHGSGSNFRFNGGTEIRICDKISSIKQKTAAYGAVITLENIIT